MMDTVCAGNKAFDLDVENLKIGDTSVNIRINDILPYIGGINVSIGSFHGVLFSKKLKQHQASGSNNNGVTAKLEESTAKSSLIQEQLSPAQLIVRNRDLRTTPEVMPRPVETRSTYGVKHPNQPLVKWKGKRKKTRAEAMAEKTHTRSSGGLPSHGSNCTCAMCVELRKNKLLAKPATQGNKWRMPAIPAASVLNSSSKQCMEPPTQKVVKSSGESNKLSIKLSPPPQADNSKSSLKVKISSTTSPTQSVAKNGSFEPGGVVWVKMRGYPYWPAVVNTIATRANGGNSYNVQWCGSPQTSDVTSDKLLDFEQNFKKTFDGKKKRKSDDYKNAVEEAKKLANHL